MGRHPESIRCGDGGAHLGREWQRHPHGRVVVVVDGVRVGMGARRGARRRGSRVPASPVAFIVARVHRSFEFVVGPTFAKFRAHRGLRI